MLCYDHSNGRIGLTRDGERDGDSAHTRTRQIQSTMFWLRMMCSSPAKTMNLNTIIQIKFSFVFKTIKMVFFSFQFLKYSLN